MQRFFILHFLTSSVTPILLVPACIVAAAVAGLAVWLICRRAARKAAAQNESTKKKLEYLTYLTNEIRTPITLISTPLQKLTRNSYDEETDIELKSMLKNAEKVTTLLDRFLNADRLDKPDSELAFREINLVKYLSNAIPTLSYQANMSQVELAFHCDKEKISAWLDRGLFDEVLMNLLDYCIRSTPSGGSVDVELSSDDKAAIIAIKDTGNGIEKDRIQNMFELFRHSESGTVSGANLELYLCREIVLQHYGTITCANRSDRKGTVFTIKLPLGNSHIPKSQITNRENLTEETWKMITGADLNPASSGKKHSIVAIDESRDICVYLSKILRHSYNVTTFTNPTEGLNAALTEVPDLVIAEVMMNEIDGISLVKRLKSNANTAHVPVLLLTALPGEDIRVQGLQTGADAIISKPFNEEEFVLSCHNLIMNRSRLASHIKEKQLSKDMLQPIELQSNNDSLMQRVLAVINEHLSDPGLNVEMLADAIGISRGHLHRKIKEITGSSPGEYIRAIRLNQAAQLLKGDKKNIAQIAYSVGYSNPSVFSTAFKQFFGVSAKEYQKRFAGTADEEQGKAI